MWVKLFVDSDRTSTKVLVNPLNQPKPNSAEKHLCWLYTAAPDKDANVEKIFGILNPHIDAVKSIEDKDLQFLLCCDLKQLWQGTSCSVR